MKNKNENTGVSLTVPALRRLALLAAAVMPAALAWAQAGAAADLADLSLEELAQLEITSVSRRPRQIAHSPSAVQVITSDEIRRSGADSIPQALRIASNLQVAQETAQGWVVTARGFSSDVGNKLLVMMDGRTIYTPLFSGVFWYRHDYVLADLDRIEVVSGPGGAVWGANAVNGVINIITKSAEDTQGLRVEAGFGSELEGYGSARYGGRIGDGTYYRVYGKYTERDGLEFADGDPVPDDWYMAQGGFRVDTQLSPRDSFTLQGDYYENRIHEEIIPGSHARTSGGNLLGRWTRTFSEDSDFTLQIYYDRTDLELPSPGFAIGGVLLAPAGVFGDELDTVDIDFQHRFSLGARHRILWGLGYRYTHDVVENAPPLGFTDGNLDQDLFSAFISDEVVLVPERVLLMLGTKLEHFEYTELEVEPSVRLHWRITDRHMLWSAVSRAVRTPSRIDRDIAQPFPPFLTILAGGPGFDSEEVIAYELGYRASIGEYALLSIASFYNEYDDLRSTSLSPPDPVLGLPFPLFFENNLHGETYGLELDLNWQLLDWWRLRVGYTFMEQDIRVKPGKFDFNNALNETADPKNQFSLRSTMDLPGNIELDAALRWVDRLPMNNVGVREFMPGYTELDVRLGWRPVESLEVSIVGQNLLHDSHPEFGLAGPFRHEVERSVYGRIVWAP